MQVTTFIKTCKEQIDILQNSINDDEANSKGWLGLKGDNSNADTIAHKHGVVWLRSSAVMLIICLIYLLISWYLSLIKFVGVYLKSRWKWKLSGFFLALLFVYKQEINSLEKLDLNRKLAAASLPVPLIFDTITWWLPWFWMVRDLYTLRMLLMLLSFDEKALGCWKICVGWAIVLSVKGNTSYWRILISNK